MKRIAKFEKVSLTQFKAGCTREDAEKVYEGIKLPKRATAGSAGYDVYVLNRNSREQSAGVKPIRADRHALGDVLRRFAFD